MTGAVPVRGSTPFTGSVPQSGEHGGDASRVARAMGLDESQMLDLSMSLNPFAPDFRPLLHRAIDRGVVGRYPDEAPALRALADAIGVPAERLVLTNGGAEAIAVVATTLGTGWADEQEFSLYRRSIRVLDPSGPRFRSNPHNPLGLLAAPEERAGVWDEAFFALATGSWTRGDADNASGSIVVGSLTKLLGCPGLRAGYVICPDPELALAVSANRPQWALNALAAECLPEMLEQVDLQAWASSIAEARGLLADVLESYHSRCGRLTRTGYSSRDSRNCGSSRTTRCGRAGLHELRLAWCVEGGGARGSRPGAAWRTRSVPRWTIATRKLGARARHDAPLDVDSLRGGIFVCGTGSDVGKSAVVTGLCRLLARRGISVAPFKAQNMALNSWVTEDGAEIGRAQGVQAVAAGVPADALMNPVLLKPTGDRRSQVVVLGKRWADLDAVGYQAAKAQLAPLVSSCLSELRERFDVVVCEGAGKPGGDKPPRA